MCVSTSHHVSHALLEHELALATYFFKARGREPKRKEIVQFYLPMHNPKTTAKNTRSAKEWYSDTHTVTVPPAMRANEKILSGSDQAALDSTPQMSRPAVFVIPIMGGRNTARDWSIPRFLAKSGRNI